MRASSLAQSSRARLAMSLTALNSSRETKSRPPRASFIRSRALSRASRVMPANVPAAALATLTKSAIKGFSLCIGRIWSCQRARASLERDALDGVRAVDTVCLRIEPHELVIEDRREEHPREVRQQQQSGRSAHLPEQHDRDDNGNVQYKDD